MKKILLVLAFVGTGLLANAQLEKSTIMVSGNVGFSSSTNDQTDDKNSNWNFGPEVGYFVADNLMVHANVGLSGSKFTPKTGPESETSSFDFGLGVRKYFPIEDEFAFYAGLGFMMGSGKAKAAGTTVNETKSMDVGLNAGFTFFPAPKVGLSVGLAGLGYSSQTNVGIGPGSKDVKDSGLNFDISTATFGFSVGYFFGN